MYSMIGITKYARTIQIQIKNPPELNPGGCGKS